MNSICENYNLQNSSKVSAFIFIRKICTIGWHSNWPFSSSRDSVLHCCQLWHPPQSWEIFILPWKFGDSIIFMLKTCIPNFKSRRLIQKNLCKIYQHGIAVRKVSQLPTLTPSQELRKFFLPMKFLEQKHFYVVCMCEKFQVQKTHTKNNIPNLPTGVVVRNKEENCLTTLTASLGLSICYFNMKIFTRVINFKIFLCQKFHFK